MIIDLTVREIMDLAEASGLAIDKTKLPSEDELEAVMCLARCHPGGLKDDDGVIEHYSLVMYCEDCPEEGVIPLGNPITKISREKFAYIEVSAEVRYWEDAIVNGVQDESGDLIPLRDGQHWKPVIRLVDGAIMDWPQGIEADIHYKVCDQGEYWLQDESRHRVAKLVSDYVPDDFLCHGSVGHGDYIIFKVSADGVIDGWRAPAVDMDLWRATQEHQG